MVGFFLPAAFVRYSGSRHADTINHIERARVMLVTNTVVWHQRRYKETHRFRTT